METSALIALISLGVQTLSQMYADGRKQTTEEESAALAAAITRGVVADTAFDAMVADADKQTAVVVPPAAPVMPSEEQPYP